MMITRLFCSFFVVVFFAVFVHLTYTATCGECTNQQANYVADSTCTNCVWRFSPPTTGACCKINDDEDCEYGNWDSYTWDIFQCTETTPPLDCPNSGAKKICTLAYGGWNNIGNTGNCRCNDGPYGARQSHEKDANKFTVMTEFYQITL